MIPDFEHMNSLRTFSFMVISVNLDEGFCNKVVCNISVYFYQCTNALKMFSLLIMIKSINNRDITLRIERGS